MGLISDQLASNSEISTQDAVSADIKIQVCIFAFDLLFLNGESLIEKPLRKRREFLYEYFPLTPTKLMFAVNMNSSNLETIQEFLDKSVKGTLKLKISLK